MVGVGARTLLQLSTCLYSESISSIKWSFNHSVLPETHMHNFNVSALRTDIRIMSVSSTALSLWMSLFPLQKSFNIYLFCSTMYFFLSILNLPLSNFIEVLISFCYETDVPYLPLLYCLLFCIFLSHYLIHFFFLCVFNFSYMSFSTAVFILYMKMRNEIILK